jgi:class 3 adenylate cyclase
MPGSFVGVPDHWGDPHLARFIRRVETLGRVVRFNRRGVGLSDPIDPRDVPDWESYAQDAIAVLDAVGVERACVIASISDGPAALTLAALHPQRVEALVLVNVFARALWADDYVIGLPAEVIDVSIRESTRVAPRETAEPDFMLSLMAPSLVEDKTFREWWQTAGNRGASPAVAMALLTQMMTVDVRSLLPHVTAPTLVLQRLDNPSWTPEFGRYVAEAIPGALFVGLTGADILCWAGDQDALLDEVEEFLTGHRSGRAADRALLTVLFTDIVGSTQLAADKGDQAWRRLLDRHDLVLQGQIERFGGRLVKTTGDGALATFTSPTQALSCARAAQAALDSDGLQLRAGLHTGEVELRGEDVGGVAVHIAARVSAIATPGDVLVSRTVADVVLGSGVELEPAGEHDLKGVPGRWQIYRVRPD